MSPDLRECEAQALKLSPRERATLGKRLIASLGELNDAESEQLWLEETDRRFQEFKGRDIEARPPPDVLRAAGSAIS